MKAPEMPFVCSVHTRTKNKGVWKGKEHKRTIANPPICYHTGKWRLSLLLLFVVIPPTSAEFRSFPITPEQVNP